MAAACLEQRAPAEAAEVVASLVPVVAAHLLPVPAQVVACSVELAQDPAQTFLEEQVLQAAALACLEKVLAAVLVGFLEAGARAVGPAVFLVVET